MNRRHCIKSIGTLSSSALLSINLSSLSYGLIGDVGIQLFSLPKLLDEDFKSAISLLSQMGYKKLELYGPFPFSADVAKESWNAITPMLGFSGSGYFGYSANEIRAILDESGISVPSLHTDLDTLMTRMAQLGEAGEVLGSTYVGLPAIPAERRVTLDDYKRIADDFNAIGEEANRVGLKFAYHNHGYGLQELEGTIPLNLIIEMTDSDKVFLEMDIYWTTAGGADPISYLQSYPGRYHLMHIKDMKEKVRFKGDGGDPGQWMALFPFMTTAGDGVLDINSIVIKAKETGVRHFFVEQDMVDNPQIALKRSFDYLHAL